MAAHRFNLTNRLDQACARVHLAWWRLADTLERFRDDRSGATAIEYGLLAAGISVVIISTVFALGDTLKGTFQLVLDQLTNAPTGG